MILTFDDEHIFEETQIPMRRNCVTTLRGPSRSAVGPVPETDAIVAGQSRYTKVLASGSSFQDVSGELIGVVQDRPFQSPPFISKTNFL